MLRNYETTVYYLASLFKIGLILEVLQKSNSKYIRVSTEHNQLGRFFLKDSHFSGKIKSGCRVQHFTRETVVCVANIGN